MARERDSGYSPDLQDVIEDPDFTEPVGHRHDQTTDADYDGRADFDLGPRTDYAALIADAQASPFAVTELGQVDETAFAMCLMLDRGVDEDDRILYDDGLHGEQPYRVVEVAPVQFDSEQFAWYRLIEDTRGETTSDTDSGSDTTDTTETDGVR